jgi:hypothetical protein
MEKRMLSAALAASLLCAGGMACAQNAPVQATQTTTTTTTVATSSNALTEDQITSDIWVRIRIGPTTGKVYQADAPSRLNKDEIKARLTAAGYQNIDDVEFDDGLWSAEAKSPQGDDVDLLVDPDDGSVVASQHD